MASAFQLSGLTDYVNVHKDELLVKAQLENRTIKYVDIMPNVKWKDSIPTLSSEVTLQPGNQCGFNPTGSDTFGEKFIETHAVKSEKEWCAKDWEKKYANYQLLWEAGRVETPYAEFLANYNLGLVQEALEEVLWQGDSGLSIDGYIKDITVNESASTIAVTAITSANTVTEAVDAVVAAMPINALKKGVRIFLSYTNLRNYIMAANSNCCVHKDPYDAASEEIAYFGDSRVKLVAVNGIGDDFICGASLDSMVYATDVENAENRYSVWFDEEDEMLRWRVLFRAGTALRYADEVAYASLA